MDIPNISNNSGLILFSSGWALGEMGGEEALTALTIHRAKEKDNYVIEEINGALERQVEKG